MQGFSGISKFLGLCVFFLLSCSTIEPRHKPTDLAFADKAPQVLGNFLDSSKPNRTSGSAGNKAAFAFIKARFDSIAKETKGRVIIHEFTPDIDFAVKNYENDFNTLIKSKYPKTSPIYKKWAAFTNQAVAFVKSFKDVKGRNLILEIPGKSEPDSIVYVGAHYDTVINDHTTLKFSGNTAAPGADDNASAITALLLMAEELKSEHPERTIRFVAFDFEEVFFLGSHALAEDLSSRKPRWMRAAENPVGLINLEMLGWSKATLANHPPVKIYTREKGKPGSEQDVEIANFFMRAAVLTRSPLQFSIVQNGFNRSDNWTFWQKSIPAICLSEDWEKDFNENNYHTANDTPDTLNFPYLIEIIKVATEAVAEMCHITAPNFPN